MDTKDYLSYIVNEIHSTVVATVDEDGLPVTCAIDMMDCDKFFIRNPLRCVHYITSCFTCLSCVDTI